MRIDFFVLTMNIRRRLLSKPAFVHLGYRKLLVQLYVQAMLEQALASIESHCHRVPIFRTAKFKKIQVMLC